jgi:ribonuclease HI
MEMKRYRVGVRGGLQLPNPILLGGVLMSEAQYRVWCDGGCANNGNRGLARGYASYLLTTRTGKRQTVRLNDLPGVTTNNEAEYVAFISALVDLRGRIERAGKSPRNYSVAVHTDSQLLVGQLTQGWKVKAANLHPLVDEAAALMRTFGRYDLVKVPREEIVRVLGH